MIIIDALITLLSFILLFSNRIVLSFIVVLISQVLIPQWDVWLHAFLPLCWILICLRKYRLNSRSKYYSKLFLIYGLSILLLSFFSDIPIYRSLYSSVTMILKYCGLGLMLLLTVRRKEELRLIFIVFGIVTLVSSVYAIFCLITLSNPYTELMSNFYPRISEYTEGFSDDIRGITARITGVFPHPLVLGEYSLLAFCVLMEMIAMFKKRVLGYFFLLLTVIALVLSGTRSCIVALLVFLFIFLSSYFFRIKYWAVTLFIVLPIGFWGYSQLDTNTKELIEASVFFYDESKSSSISGSSISLREEQLDYTLKQDAKVLIMGHGPGYITYSSTINKREYVMAGYESIIFSKVAEEGVIGLFLFFLLIYFLFHYTVSNSSNMYRRKVLSYYISYIVCIIMTNIQGTGHLFFFGCALLMLYKNIPENIESHNINEY